MPSETAVYTIDTPRPVYPFIPDYIPKEEPVSVHVLTGEETVLFGTGFASGVTEIIRRMKDIGEIDVVMIEHGHPDHYDALPILEEWCGDLTVAIPEADAGVLDAIDVDPDVILQHDDVQWGVRALHLPGHTPGNMSFLHEETGTLFVGDTVVHSTSPNAASGDWNGAFSPVKPVLNHDDAQARSVIAELQNYSFDDARLTHGPNVTGAQAELETLLADLERQPDDT